MTKQVSNWQLDPALLMIHLHRRVLRGRATWANWPAQNLTASATRRAVELIGSHTRTQCRSEGKSAVEAEGIVRKRAADPRWVSQAHLATAVLARYKAGLATFAKALKLTADHPDATQRQFDAMDLLGACEDYRVWRPQEDLGLKYRGQVNHLGQARHKDPFVKSLQLVAKNLRDHRLALGLLTKRALDAAGLTAESERFKDLASEDYETAAIFDFWYTEIPLFASMLADALQQLSRDIANPPKQRTFESLPVPDMVRIGHILFGHSNFPLPQMPRIGLVIGLVQLLANISGLPAGRRGHSEYVNVDSSRQRIPGYHYKIVAAFVSAAFEIDYTAAAAAKAVQKFRSRHPNYMIMNWPFQREDEGVQSLQ